MKTSILVDNANSRYNNLNLMRLMAAIMVIICHSIPICAGAQNMDVIGVLSGGVLNLGGLAVGVFFVTGGYLIAGSAERKQSAKSFFKARCKKIFPSLMVTILVCTVIIGPIFTTLSIAEYFRSSAVYKYLMNACLIPVHSLPGVFEGNAYPSVVNGSLWTLPIEFLCYIGCFTAYKLGFFEKLKFKITIPIVAIFSIAFFVLFGENVVLARIVLFIIIYYIGIGFYVFRDKIKLNIVYGMLALCLFVLSIIFDFAIIGMLLFFPYMIYVLAFGLQGKTCEFGKKYDISYGMYLWGWPIQQILFSFGGAFSVWYVNAGVAILLAGLLGLINCVLVEHRIEKRK